MSSSRNGVAWKAAGETAKVPSGIRKRGGCGAGEDDFIGGGDPISGEQMGVAKSLRTEGRDVVTTSQLKERAKGCLEHLGTDAMSHLSKIYLPTGKR